MNDAVHRIGFWAGIVAFAATLAFFVVQLLQVLGLLHFPQDQILIFGFSLCIPIPFMLEMLALHYVTPHEKRIWSHAALILSVIYVVFVTANYVVQLATVIPMTIKGRSAEVSLLIQSPHSLFWDFDAMGYIFMGLAALFAVPVFEKRGYSKWVGHAFLAHGLVTPVIAFVYFYPYFSDKLLLLAIPWGITAPVAMLLLALMFRKKTDGAGQA